MAQQTITFDDKNDPTFNKLLAVLAKSDADHDLGGKQPYPNESNKKDSKKGVIDFSNDKISELFLKGLPNEFQKDLKQKSGEEEKKIQAISEHQCLKSVIFNYAELSTQYPDLPGNKQTSSISDFLSNCCGDIITEKNVSNAIDLNIGYYPGKQLYTYSLQKIYVSASSSNKRIETEKFFDRAEPNYDDNFIKYLFEGAKLGVQEEGGQVEGAILVVDFSQHGFIEKLHSTATENKKYKICYVKNKETFNDPASKPSGFSSIFRHDGVDNLFSYIEIDKGPTYYTKYDIDNTSTNNNFFSNYGLVLSNIKRLQKNNKEFTFTTDLTFTNTDNPQPYINNEPGSKKQNSNNSVSNYIRSFQEKLLEKFSNATTKLTSTLRYLISEFNTKIQQKRSGDWLQALSCLDIYNQKFEPIINGHQYTKFFIYENNKLKKNFPTYLVTHDAIEVAFALLMGVNVIFIDYFGRVFIFKNQADTIFNIQGTIKSNEETILEGWAKSYDYFEKSFKKGLFYAEIFDAFLNTSNDKLEIYVSQTLNFKSYKSIIETLNDIVIEDITETSPFEHIQTIIKTIFRQSVYAVFIDINIPKLNKVEIDNYYKIFLRKKQENFQYNPVEKYDINEIHNFLNKMDYILKTFGDYDINLSQESPYKSILKFINTIDNSQLIKVINKIQLKQPLSSRIINLLNRDNHVNTDAFIFLPYIQNLNDEIKKIVIEKLKSIKNVMDKFLEKKITPPTQRTTRLGKRSFFYNILESDSQSLEPVKRQIAETYKATMSLIAEAQVFLSFEKTPSQGGGDKQIGGTSLWDEPEEREADNIIYKDITSSYINDAAIIDEDYQFIDPKNNLIQFYLPEEESISEEITDLDEISVNIKATLEQNGGGSIGESKKCETIIDFDVSHITWPYLKYLLYNKTLEEQQRIVLSIISHYDLTNVVVDGDDYKDQLKELLSERKDILGKQAGGTPEKDLEFKQIYNFFKYAGDNPAIGEAIIDKIYHPLLPIYMLLTSFYCSLEPGMVTETYETYYKILHKMTEVLVEYLNNPNQLTKAFLIGLGLGNMFFVSNTSPLLEKTIIKNFAGDQKSQFITNFTSINDSVSFSMLSGVIYLDPKEEETAWIIINSELFKNFITEVNINGTITIYKEREPEEYTNFKAKMLNLMDDIRMKVNEDRNMWKLQAKKDLTSLNEAIEYQPSEPLIKQRRDFPSLNEAIIEYQLSEPRKFPSLNLTFQTPQKSPISPASYILTPENNITPQNLFGKKSGGKKTYKKNRNKKRITIKKNKNYRKKTIKHKRIKRITRMLKLKLK